jgi:hypothetical protein
MSHVGKLTSLIAFVGLCWAATQLEAQQPDEQFKQDVRQGVDRGVTFLRKSQAPDGTWPHPSQKPNTPPSDQTIGTTAMCALALVEAGLDIDDPTIQKAATVIRSQLKVLTDIQAIAAAILFLDRISRGGEAGNFAMLSLRLMQAQHPTGGWSSQYPPKAGEAEDINSTHHAALALWIARRNGVKVDRSLQTAEKRFRENQNRDGGWNERMNADPAIKSTPAATCASLLILAFGHGTRYRAESILPLQQRRPDLKADPQVLKAKDFLARHLAQPFQPGPHDTYFLWMLEQVCMTYGYPQFNGLDWYVWGIKNLLRLQTPRGSWTADVTTGPYLETAWALLFLRKSNLAADLDIGLEVREGEGFKRRDRSTPRKPLVEPVRESTPGEAKALQEELRTAIDSERVKEILNLLGITRGSEYTQALAEAITLVRPDFREQVRLALQRRLLRMTTGTLQIYLSTEDKELRLASLMALAKREDVKELIPEIIPLLGDREPQIATAALETLKKISRKDFGRVSAAWRKWWVEGGKK